jgi:hypothetical protein
MFCFSAVKSFLGVERCAGIAEMEGGDGQAVLVGNRAAVRQPDVRPVSGVTVAPGGRVHAVASIQREFIL